MVGEKTLMGRIPGDVSITAWKTPNSWKKRKLNINNSLRQWPGCQRQWRVEIWQKRHNQQWPEDGMYCIMTKRTTTIPAPDSPGDLWWLQAEVQSQGNMASSSLCNQGAGEAQSPGQHDDGSNREDWPTKCTSMDKPVRTTCTQSSKASGEGTGGQGSKLLLRSWSAPKKTPANWLKCVVGQYEILALPWTRKMVSTTILNTVSAIITEIDRFTKGRPWDDLKCDSARVDELGWQWPYLKARSAMSWNQMALTTLESRKNGRTQRVEKATDRTGWV